ncbi:MAG: hypothetical protein ACUVQW_00610 [Candidatus Bathycorpusculaceae bacterium]
MKKTLIMVASAVFCGILAMLLPLYVWHQANFPDKPATLGDLKQESLQKLKNAWGLQEPSFITPFYMALTLSFTVAAIAYVFLKKRL